MTGVTASDDMVQLRRLHFYPDIEDMRRDVVSRITTLASTSIHQRGSFHVVLAGGTTPRAIYQQLCTIETDWSAWHIYFGDERCFPKTDSGRNDSMAQEVWLGKVGIPDDQIHLIPAELGAQDGAYAYAQVLANVDHFDLVLLGLGEDGHTASLFPGHAHNDKDLVIALHDSPQPPPERISLSARMLGKGENVWFLVNGVDKREALNRWQQGEQIPASTIHPRRGVDIFTDVDLTDI